MDVARSRFQTFPTRSGVPYTFQMGKRIKIEGKQLATVIYVWLRAVPKWAWGEEPRYASLKKMKRHNPRDEPDPPQIVAELIAENLKGLDWEVSYEEQGNLFQSVGEGRKETTPPGPKE